MLYSNFLKPLFTDIKTFLLDTFFPKTCLSCEAEGSFLCAPCQNSLKLLEQQHCIVCQKQTPFGLTHTGCQTPYGADALISFYDYHDDNVAKILIKGKYSFLPEVYQILGNQIAKKLLADFPHLLEASSYKLKPILIPIPLNKWRQRWRGFNQAKILCEAMSKELELDVVDALIRKKITKTQKDLKREARLKNVRDAFKVSVPDKSYILHHKSYILVDDVTTTGATLQEAARTLKKSGAAKVICLTVARD